MTPNVMATPFISGGNVSVTSASFTGSVVYAFQCARRACQSCVGRVTSWPSRNQACGSAWSRKYKAHALPNTPSIRWQKSRALRQGTGLRRRASAQGRSPSRSMRPIRRPRRARKGRRAGQPERKRRPPGHPQGRMPALLERGVRNFGVLFVVGEERNSAGAYHAAARPKGARYLINGEPTENKLALGSKGALRYEIAAAGRMAH